MTDDRAMERNAMDECASDRAMDAGTSTRAVVMGAGQGKAIWFLGNLMVLKATAASTNGAYGLLESWVRAGASPPLHVHHREDETFWILEGSVTVRCGEETFEAGAGSYVFLPRGVPHTFRVNGEAPAHMLTMLSPGGGEAFFVEGGRPAESATFPPPSAPDLARLERVAHEFGSEFVGPPLPASGAR
ncbi:MAG TPA: quercetin 2,3-dioxygenase [Gemmatimonadaceae bacterium]|nr:quercetin 2,3-dioxygenase [Gemmatimonadaceae bacterium]